ncbi:MAG: MFS transporter [Methanomassiliicoccales archaeon]
MNREQKLILSLMVAVMMGAIDSTIVILALPTITIQLRTGLASSIWIIMVYLLMLAVGTTQLGRLGDMFTRKRIFNAGLIVFTLSSALCGAAFSITELIAFRTIQGAGAAMIQSNSGAIIAENFPPNKRGRIFGYTSVGYNAGAMLGIILGGIITTFVSWRYIFYINVPVGIFASYYTFKYINAGQKTANKLDLPGTALLAGGLALLSYSAVDISTYGIRLLNETLIIIGALIICVFVAVERYVQKPLLPPGIFKSRILTFSMLASFLQSLGFLSVVFIIIIYLQGVRGLTPLDSSLLLLPGYVVGSVLGPYFGRLADRVGARIPATGGLGIMAISILVYSTLRISSPLYIILISSFLTGTGSSMFYPANNSAVMANSPKELYGVSSGFLRTMANIGMLGSFVVAISIASISVPRDVAFAVFAGIGGHLGYLPAAFMTGIHAALFTSLGIVLVAAIMSSARGKENRQQVS